MEFRIQDEIFEILSPKLPKRGIKHFSISNIDRFEKEIWSLPFLPLLDFPAQVQTKCTFGAISGWNATLYKRVGRLNRKKTFLLFYVVQHSCQRWRQMCTQSIHFYTLFYLLKIKPDCVCVLKLAMQNVLDPFTLGAFFLLFIHTNCVYWAQYESFLCIQQERLYVYCVYNSKLPKALRFPKPSFYTLLYSSSHYLLLVHM